MHVTTGILFLRMIDELVHVALHCPIATRGVRIESAPRLDREVGRFLHCLDGKVPRRLDDHGPLATDPGNNGRPVFVIVAPARLALLAASTHTASQGFLPALLPLALVARRVIELIRFDRPLQLAVHLIGQGGIAQPPAPAIARADMDSQFPGDAPRRACQTEQKGGENPVCEGALAAVQECTREVIEGALAVLRFTAVALQSRLVVIGPPGTNMVALAPGTLELSSVGFSLMPLWAAVERY